MKRSDVEEGLLDLIRNSPLGPELLHASGLEIYDERKVDENGQLAAVTPFVWLVPGMQEFKKADIYGSTNEQDMFVSFLVGATNYRSPAARRQGELGGEIGVNEMLDLVKDAIRGQNPIPSIDPGARVHLVLEKPFPDVGPGCVYELTVRVGSFLQPA